MTDATDRAELIERRNAAKKLLESDMPLSIEQRKQLLKIIQYADTQLVPSTQLMSYSGEIESDSYLLTQPSKRTSKRAGLRIGVIGLCVIVFIVFFFTQLWLNADEQLTYQCALELKSIMRDPDSFQIDDDESLHPLLLFKEHDGDGSIKNTYLYIPYRSRNGFGGMGNDVAVFKNERYICDFYEDYDDLSLETQVKYSLAKAPLMNYLIDEDPGENYETININARKVENRLRLRNRYRSVLFG